MTDSFDPDTDTHPEAKAELNVFVRSPQGFDGHIKVLVPQKQAAAFLLSLAASLDEKGFTPSQRFGPGRAAAPEKTSPAPPQRPTGGRTSKPTKARRAPDDDEVPECDYCGGDVWDNRGDKRTPKSPDYKCRSKQCGGAAWMQDDGSLRWVEGG